MATSDEARQELAAPLAEVPARESQQTAWRRFRRHHMALLGLAILAVFGILVIFAPLIAWHHPYHTDLDLYRAAPTWDHILGNDDAGRDVFSRLLHGGRVSMSVGIVAALIASIIGAVIGLVSGYIGGWVDNLLQRFTELVMTFPSFFALIILVSVVGPSVYNLMIVIGFLGWTGKARLVRGQVLSVRQMDYVTAARAVGATQGRLMFVHILPTVMGYVAVAGMLTVAGAIITEASLSFLGLGVRMPTPTWGNMITGAQSLFVLKELPWIWVPPGVAISITVIAVNFVGDGLRDALDPRTRIE